MLVKAFLKVHSPLHMQQKTYVADCPIGSHFKTLGQHDHVTVVEKKSLGTQIYYVVEWPNAPEYIKDDDEFTFTNLDVYPADVVLGPQTANESPEYIYRFSKNELSAWAERLVNCGKFRKTIDGQDEHFLNRIGRELMAWIETDDAKDWLYT